MKLQTKLSLLFVAVLLLTVSVLSALLLGKAKENILQAAVLQAEAKQRDLAASVRESVRYYASYPLEGIDEETIVKYCFGHYADAECVLTRDGRTVFSLNDCDPEALLPLSGGRRTTMTEQDGKALLIVGSPFQPGSGVYSLYVVQDVTHVHRSIAHLAWQFALVSAVLIGLGAALTVWLVRRATRPIRLLAGAARRIAAGEYAERACVFAPDEVGGLASDFNRMAASVEERIGELQATAERQRLFIGALTHEFKTPLSSLLLHSDLLLDAKMREDDRESSLRHIRSQTLWLERLTQALLQLIQVDRGIAVQPESVSALLQAVADDMQETLAARGTPLDWECEADALPINRTLMQSLLTNLVDNASKASQPGQRILMRAFDRSIEVIDSGAGIPEAALIHVTEPFYMADPSRSKRQGGSGLGLALAARIADAHRATLTIESAPGRGTRVLIEFPR